MHRPYQTVPDAQLSAAIDPPTLSHAQQTDLRLESVLDQREAAMATLLDTLERKLSDPTSQFEFARGSMGTHYSTLRIEVAAHLDLPLSDQLMLLATTAKTLAEKVEAVAVKEANAISGPTNCQVDALPKGGAT